MSSRSRAHVPAAILAAALLASLLSSVLFSGPAGAQTPRGGRILVDVPAVEISGRPGITSPDRVQIVNQSATEAEVDVTVEDVGGDARGDLVAVPRGSGTGRSAAAWVTATPDNLRIAANGSAVVDVKIAVPKGTAAGGYYAAVTFATSPDVPPDQRPSHLLLIKVPGAAAVARARLNGLTMPGVTLSGSVRFDLRLENIGTVHTIGSGRVVVTDLFGKRVATLRVPPVVVFPGLERVVSITWNSPPIVARLRARAEVSFGGEPSAQTAAGFSLIWWMAALTLAVVALLMVALLRLAGVVGRRRVPAPSPVTAGAPAIRPAGHPVRQTGTAPPPAGTAPAMRTPPPPPPKAPPVPGKATPAPTAGPPAAPPATTRPPVPAPQAARAAPVAVPPRPDPSFWGPQPSEEAAEHPVPPPTPGRSGPVVVVGPGPALSPEDAAPPAERQAPAADEPDETDETAEEPAGVTPQPPPAPFRPVAVVPSARAMTPPGETTELDLSSLDLDDGAEAEHGLDELEDLEDLEDLDEEPLEDAEELLFIDEDLDEEEEPEEPEEPEPVAQEQPVTAPVQDEEPATWEPLAPVPVLATTPPAAVQEPVEAEAEELPEDEAEPFETEFDEVEPEEDETEAQEDEEPVPAPPLRPASRGKRPIKVAPLPPVPPATRVPVARVDAPLETPPAVPASGGSAMALRRAEVALRMITGKPGETGAILDAGLDLLYTVRTDRAVVARVEQEYAETRNRRRLGPLSLALFAVQSPAGPRALLDAYATAPKVVADRIRRAILACDPAEIRTHRSVIDALSAARKATLGL